MTTRRHKFTLAVYMGALCFISLAHGEGLLPHLHSVFQPAEHGPFSQGDYAGSAVALDGTWAAIGAPGSREYGFNANGNVLLFEWSGGVWRFRQRLLAPQPSDGAQFGSAIDFDNGLLVVGAPGEYHRGVRSGKAYVYSDRSSSGHWERIAELLPNDPGSNSEFGSAVAIYDGRILIGAPKSTSRFVRDGAAYLFEPQWGSGAWIETQKFTAIDAESYDEFGSAVALDRDLIVVGAPMPQALAVRPGTAYVFEPDSSSAGWRSWVLSAPNSLQGDRFGSALSVRSGVIAIGADILSTSVDYHGGVFLFSREADSATWVSEALLLPDDLADRKRFGAVVGWSATSVFVGAPRDSEYGRGAGAVYRFDYFPDEDLWLQVEKIPDPSGGFLWNFGLDLSVDNTKLVVGSEGRSAIWSQSPGFVILESETDTEAWALDQVQLPPIGSSRFQLGEAIDATDSRLAVAAALDFSRTPNSMGVVSVYARWRGESTWHLEGSLSPWDGNLFGQFGSSVAISNSFLAVGSYADDEVVPLGGAIYLFERDRATGDWQQHQKLLPMLNTTFPELGIAVSMTDHYLAASYHSGEVSVYQYDSGTGYWLEHSNLIPTIGELTSVSHQSLVIREDLILTSGRLHHTDHVGVAFLFRLEDNEWRHIAILHPPDGSQEGAFAASLDLADDYAVVGAPRMAGVGSSDRAGLVFIYKKGTTFEEWSLMQVLEAPVVQPSARFGESIYLRGSSLLVGAPGTSDQFVGEGGAYFYQLASGAEEWTLTSPLSRNFPDMHDLFGSSVAVSNDALIVGAPYVDHSSTDSGAVFLFSLDTVFADSLEGTTSASH